ncbi:hypothetical protein CYLTODRAFT_427234 [Cylindrobasidium torrendii FP15055 ss-10]|uniref:RGS domain-containing protein n=1 Tax=Cylindrobasidium torrendii FP15055 ss-10 TaxID=1314674 RepID=A0A0D7AXK0_9AGAR|nr:hypothetical protein CYLTODRAFT_427234 [Cylindrobasidium torrendii FP15055 ss-10]
MTATLEFGASMHRVQALKTVMPYPMDSYISKSGFVDRVQLHGRRTMSYSDDDEHERSLRSGSSTRRKRPKQDYMSKLYPWAERMNARRLSSVTLEEVLSGGTCFPISLPDFELYLAFNEMSIEQLQFVVWFRDYRKRVQARSVRGRPESQLSFASTSTDLTTPKRVASLTSTDSAPIIDILSNIHTNNIVLNDPALREECMSVVSTFFLPNSPKELSVDHDMRQRIIKGLENNCHYSLFEPIYKQIYTTLERTVLPRFLGNALPNINMPKQILWYSAGSSLIAVAIILAALTIHFVPEPRVNRAWRLISIIPMHAGVSAVVAAFLGFCSQVFHRDARQIHAWEMRQVDEEAAHYVENVRARVDSIPLAVICNATDGSYNGIAVPVARKPEYVARSDVRLVRPAMFGPEQVIEDKTVLKAHRGLMNDLVMIAVLCDLIFGAVIFSIPGHST